jgi:dTDP-4-amino-4,6-dideoxygalactose transaminase
MFVSNLPVLSGGAQSLVRRHRLVESPKLQLFGQGRQALAAALRSIGPASGSEALLPASLCAEAVLPYLAAGMNVRYYRLTPSLDVDLDDLKQKVSPRVRAVHLVHYYGARSNVDAVRAVCDARDVVLIEDCALCLFDGAHNGGVGQVGDFAVFSPWKFLPIPDGGILMANRRSSISSVPLARPKSGTAARFLARVGVHCVRQLFPGFAIAASGGKATVAVSPEERAMTRLGRALLERTDFERVRSARLHNYDVLATWIGELRIGSPLFRRLPKGCIPYSLPIVVQNAADLQRRLRSRGVDTEVSLSGPMQHDARILNREERFPVVERLAPLVLSLPVHQAIGPQQLRFIRKALERTRCT